MKTLTLIAALALAACGMSVSDGNGINYHGGRVLTGDTALHFVWVGSWSDERKQDLRDLITHTDGSTYFATVRTYHDSAGNRPSGRLLLSAETKAPAAASLPTRDSVHAQVEKALSGEPDNVAAVVMVAADVPTYGIAETVTGYHWTHGNKPYLVVVEQPNPATARWVLLHELAEMITDPDRNAWFAEDTAGSEVVDLCADAGNDGLGSTVQLNGVAYYVESIWQNAHGGGCVTGE